MTSTIDILHEAPLPKEYNALRVKAGLSPRDEAGAAIALSNSIFVISLRQADELIGMGRIKLIHESSSLRFREPLTY